MEVYFSLTEKDALAMAQAEGGQKAALGAMPNVQLQLADGGLVLKLTPNGVFVSDSVFVDLMQV